MSIFLRRIASKIRFFSTKYPIIRGMVSYAILWPTSSYLQQRIEGKTRETIDWDRCKRYSIYGCFITATSLHMWVRFTSILLPQNTLKVGAVKALLEQIVFEPIFLYTFFMIMCLWEGKSLELSQKETAEKLWPTYVISWCFWPVFQTVNFAYIPERNRVLMVSFASLGWVTFLAYMKQLNLETKQSSLQSSKK